MAATDRDAGGRAAGLMLLTTPVIWGLTFPAAKMELEHVNPGTVTTWRRVLGLHHETPWRFPPWSRVLGLAALCAVVAVVRPPRETWQRGLIPAGALLG